MSRGALSLDRQCVVCGAALPPGSRSSRRYCSGKCNSAAFRNRKKPPVASRLCERCGQAFETSIATRKYCTRKCRDAARIREVTGEGKGWSGGRVFVPRTACEICGAAFYAPPIQRRRGGGRFCSRACRAKDVARHPDQYPQTAHRRGRGGKRADLDGAYFRSAWEANYARYLNWLVSLGQIASWRFESDTFQFHGIKRGARFYTPDFRVMTNAGGIEYHEVKGWMDARSATQLRRMAKYYPAVKVVLIDAECYRGISRKVAGIIPHWERGTEHFKAGDGPYPQH